MSHGNTNSTRVIEKKASFREFVQDLFPNNVIGEGSIDEIENNFMHGRPVTSACDRIDVVVFLGEICMDLKMRHPNRQRILEDKLYLATLFGKQDLVEMLKKEQDSMLNFKP